MKSKNAIKRAICLLLSVTIVFSSIIINEHYVSAKKNFMSFKCTKMVKKKRINYSVTFETRRKNKKNYAICTLKKTGEKNIVKKYYHKQITQCKTYGQVLKKCNVNQKAINAYNKCVNDACYSALILKMAKKKYYYKKKKGKTKQVKEKIDDYDRMSDLTSMMVEGKVSTIIQKYFSENTPSATKIALKKFKKELIGYGFPIELYDAFKSVEGLKKGYFNLVNIFKNAQQEAYGASKVFSNNTGNGSRIKKAKERINNNKYAAELYNHLK